MKKQWKTLARPMFSMNSLNFIDSCLVPGDSLENHEFMENIGQANVFHRFFTGIHGNLGKSKNSWKTLAWPMFSIAFSQEFMENIGAWPMFSMNFWIFLDSWLIPGDSLENHKFMENISLANVCHDFFTEIHGKHWPGQCFP